MALEPQSPGAANFSATADAKAEGKPGDGKPPRIAKGSPEYRATAFAMFSCGFSIFAILYCTQPILPLFVEGFNISAAESSLALSLTTICMAVAMLFASSLSEAVGRKPLMLAALFSSSVLTLALAFASEWSHILWLRSLAGVTLSGMPAVALAYLAEEMEPKAVSSAVGLYIGGGAVGGMTGRLVVAFLADYGSWRMAMVAIAITGLISCIVFWKALAPSRHFTPRALSPIALVRTLVAHMGNPGIALLVIEGFLLLGSFMVLFNYIGFRLQGAPFHLSQAVAGLVFIVYPLGSFGSATMGSWAGRYGRGKMLVITIAIMMFGLLLMFPESLISMCMGLAVLTFGFFGAHSICSGWAPALADQDKAQSSSLYLLFYYIGGGVAGSLGGIFWDWHAWTGVIGFSAALMAGTLLLAALMWRYAKVQ